MRPRDAELTKSTAVLDRKIKALSDKLSREDTELQQDQTELGQRKLEEVGNAAELGASLFGIGRKKTLTTALTKRRLTEQAKADVEEVGSVHCAVQEGSCRSSASARTDCPGDQRSLGSACQSISARSTSRPRRPDIYVNLFGVAWLPYYFVQYDGQTLELPAFGE